MSELRKIREEELEALIVDEQYVVQDTLTICTLELRSSYKVVGTSSCINPDDFDDTIGRQAARGRAVAQLWALEAYYRMAVHHAATADEEE